MFHTIHQALQIIASSIMYVRSLFMESYVS